MKESADVTNAACRYSLSYDKMIGETREVIRETGNNFSSMFSKCQKKIKLLRLTLLIGFYKTWGEKRVDNCLNKMLVWLH